MHNFGKLTAYPERIIIQPEVRDAGGAVLIPQRAVNILTLKDKDGVIWHDLFKAHPHAFYIAVTDDDVIVSMESDPEGSQITGHRIIGIDSDFGETRGPGGTVYGKIWDGHKIVTPPPVLPDLTQRQIRLGLLQEGILDKVDSIIAGFPSPLKEQAAIEWNYASHFPRKSALLKSIMKQLDLSDAYVDGLWEKFANI